MTDKVFICERNSYAIEVIYSEEENTDNDI